MPSKCSIWQNHAIPSPPPSAQGSGIHCHRERLGQARVDGNSAQPARPLPPSLLPSPLCRRGFCHPLVPGPSAGIELEAAACPASGSWSCASRLPGTGIYCLCPWLRSSRLLWQAGLTWCCAMALRWLRPGVVGPGSRYRSGWPHGSRARQPIAHGRSSAPATTAPAQLVKLVQCLDAARCWP